MPGRAGAVRDNNFRRKAIDGSMGFLPEHGPRRIPVTVPGDTGNYLHKIVVSIPRVLVAEDELFDCAVVRPTRHHYRL
jgi:hypothetical protein